MLETLFALRQIQNSRQETLLEEPLKMLQVKKSRENLKFRVTKVKSKSIKLKLLKLMRALKKTTKVLRHNKSILFLIFLNLKRK